MQPHKSTKISGSWIERQMEDLRRNPRILSPKEVRLLLGKSGVWLREHAHLFPHTVRVHTGRGLTGDERRYDPEDVLTYLESLKPNNTKPQTAREIAEQFRTQQR